MALGRDGSGGARRRLFVLGALASSAVLFFLSLGVAVVPVPLVGFLAPLPVLLLAPRVSARVAMGVAFLAAFLGMSNSWAFFAHSNDLPLPLGLTLCATLALTFALATGVFRGALVRGRALVAAVAAPAVWTGLAYLLQVTNPMGLVGTMAGGQADVPAVLQVARVTGAWGVEFLVLLVPAVVAVLGAPGAAAAARWRTAAVGVAAVTFTLTYGSWAMAGDGDTAETQRLALIVHDRAEWGVDVGTAEGRELAVSYGEQVAALPEDVDTAVLPEGAFKATDQSMSALTGPMREAARDNGVAIVVGLTHAADGEKYQKAFAFPASGQEPVAYTKHRDRVSPPGEELAFLPGDGTRTGVAICNDLTAANPSREYGTAGTGLVAMPASTEGENGWQMARTAMLRGVENGFSVGWASRFGHLTVADSHGRVLADAATGGPGAFTTVTADVPGGTGSTPYSRFGDWFAWLCLALAAGAVVGMSRWPRRHA